jgi:hypothetical protein
MAKKKEVELVKVLIERQDEDINISGLSRYAGTDYKNTHIMVKRLEKDGVVMLKRFGKNLKITLNRKPHSIIYEAEDERRRGFLENRNFLVLYRKLSSLSFHFIAMVFGSQVTGKANKGSDIDLLVVCEKERKDAIHGVVDTLPLNIHLTIVGSEDFLKMLKSREFSVVSEAVKRNIILIGIEDYYRLLENAG